MKILTGIGSRKHYDYSSNTLTAAMNDHQQGLSLRQCGEKHGIPFSTTQKNAKQKHLLPYGGQTAFTQAQEESLIKVIQVCGNWSYLLSTLKVRMIAKGILNKEG